MCNLSFTLAFFTRDPCIKVEEKARVATRSANTVDVIIDLQQLKYDQGDYLSCFEIICPGFQNIPVFIKGFLGQPLFVPLWNYVVFKPISHGQSDVIKTVIVNQSQYGISFVLEGIEQEIHVLEKEKRFENQFFCNLSSDLSSPSFIKPHSSLTVQFKFKAGRRGPLLSKVTCNVISP